MSPSFADSLMEFRGLMGSRSYWTVTTQAQRDGACKALGLAYLGEPAGDATIEARNRAAWEAAMCEHGERELLTTRLRSGSGTGEPHR